MNYKHAKSPEEIEHDVAYMERITRRSAMTANISDERLFEICNAERDGRCMVLPCQVETLVERYNALILPAEDEAETYSTVYRRGHKNGQAELLEYLLGIDTGARMEPAEKALEARCTES